MYGIMHYGLTLILLKVLGFMLNIVQAQVSMKIHLNFILRVLMEENIFVLLMELVLQLDCLGGQIGVKMHKIFD